MERKHEKYQRLIDFCKSLPPTPTAVAHPCDESSLRGRDRGGQARPDRADPGRAARAHRGGGEAARHRHLAGCEIVDAPYSEASAATAVRAGARGQGRSADEGQPAHRRADGRGGQARQRAAHGAAHQPLLRDGRARLRARRSSSPTPRSTSRRRWKTRSTSCRTRSTSRTRCASTEVRVAILSAMETVNPEGAVDGRGGGAVQDGRPRADHRRACSTARSRSTTRSASRPRRSRRSTRRWPGAPTCWWCPTSRPATCWPRACRSSPAPMPPASCSARACRSSSPAAPTR